MQNKQKLTEKLLKQEFKAVKYFEYRDLCVFILI